MNPSAQSHESNETLPRPRGGKDKEKTSLKVASAKREDSSADETSATEATSTASGSNASQGHTVGLNEWAEQLTTHIDQIDGMVRGFIQQRPVTVLAVAAAAGFVLNRLGRAAASKEGA